MSSKQDYKKEQPKESLRILNSREKKSILKQIQEQWESDFKPDVMLMSNKNKFYIITRDLQEINWQDYKIDKIGLYIGRIEKEIRLSIEGSQVIGPTTKKNVLDINKEQLDLWFKGEDLEIPNLENKELSGFIILRHQDDFIGSGKISNNKILNYVPKGRRASLI
ncbi:hypothetical protein ACFL0V_04055 [Nanoarchaeota archaeon]